MNPQITVQCSNCGQPNSVAIRQIIDAQNDPQAKAQLLSGNLNSFECTSCGQVNTVATGVLYHDAAKELLIAFVPMNLALQQGVNEEKLVGDLMNKLTATLPKEQFKAYMFSPKRALTMQGLIEQVLEADGVTPEMIEAQKERVNLLQQFIEAPDEAALIALIKANDDTIDEDFFRTMSLMLQRLMQEGQQTIAGRMMMVQEQLLEHTTFGQEVKAQQSLQEAAVRTVAQDLEHFGEESTRADFIDLALKYGDDEDKLQALVGMVRQAFDYELFQQFTTRISQAPADEREAMETVRDTIRELTEVVDQEMRMTIQRVAQFLQAVINSPDPAAMMRENLELIDDNFMTVLTANMQEAQRRQDVQSVARLQDIYNQAVALLQSQMTPELRFLNELMGMDDEAAIQAAITENADQYDDLLELVDAVEQILASQGQTEALKKLASVRETLKTVSS